MHPPGQESDALLATLGRFGAWSTDVRSGTTRWTEQVPASQGLQLRHESRHEEILELFAPEYRGLLLAAYQRCAAEGISYDLEVEAFDCRGDRLWVRVIGVPVRDEAGSIVRVEGAFQDIHRSKLAAEKHRRLAERFRATLDSLTDGFATLDPDWRITYVNPAALAMLRLSDRAVGRSFWDVFPQARNSPFEANYRLAMEQHEERRFEAYYAPLQMWIRACAFPSEQGIAISFTDATAEITAQHEMRRLNSELEERVRERTEQLRRINEELSAFTVAMAHDLRAPLAGISGFSRAAAERLCGDGDQKLMHYLTRIQAGAERMDELLAGLLELSRLGRADIAPRTLDLSALARDAIECLRAAAPERRARVVIQEGLQAQGDPRLVRTLLDNLLGNAWKFSAARDPACIELGRDLDGAFFVRDNGAGFDMARAEELFAPFRRLHSQEEFEGLGIGLASARRVVDRHGGRIWAESQPGGGTVFRFTLPRPAR